MTTCCLIFDLGKVLIDFSIERACTQIAAVAGHDVQEIKSFLFDDGLENRFEAGEFDFDHLHGLFEARVGKSISRLELSYACANIFCPMDETIELIKSLKKYSGLPLVLLSNTNHVHWEFIQKNWQIGKLFEHHILSFQIGAMKPTRKIYDAAIAVAGCGAAECFFTDDIHANVLGAIESGIDAVQFSSAAQIEQELTKRGVRVSN